MRSYKDILRGLFSSASKATPLDVKLSLQSKLVSLVKDEIKTELRQQLSTELHQQLSAELHQQLSAELHQQLSAELRELIDLRLRDELRTQSTHENVPDTDSKMADQGTIEKTAIEFLSSFECAVNATTAETPANVVVTEWSAEWRRKVRLLAGLPPLGSNAPHLEDMITEIDFLVDRQYLLAPVFKRLKARRVLYAGQCYYYNWYLSRALRQSHWRADVLNWDTNPASQIFYHGQDFQVGVPGLESEPELLNFYVQSLYDYDVVHFSNSHGITFGDMVQNWFRNRYEEHAEIYLLKVLGKSIVYTNNGCLDGVSQTAFSRWGPDSVCAICRWQNEPKVCSDERNLSWGEFRNSVADFQCLLGGNRVDFNDDPRVHETPEAYCLEPEVWDPTLEIPEFLRLPAPRPGMVRLYHAVGNKEGRTREGGINIKCTHIYVPLIEKLKKEGFDVELITPSDVPNLEVRFLQMQSDIVLEMLTYGWFGTNVREALMLGKPVICFIRPEWLESLRAEVPEYADELPIVSATPETIEAVLRDLIANPLKRLEIGKRGREFAVKWHSSETAGKRFAEIYTQLLEEQSLIYSGYTGR
jgi:glycosyltransferase involved in cell wall biosynthesis